MDGNVVNNKTAQRVASITTTKNIQSEEQNKDQLCAMKINELVKLVNDKVQGKQSSKTASVTNKPDELGLLKNYLKGFISKHKQ